MKVYIVQEEYDYNSSGREHHINKVFKDEKKALEYFNKLCDEIHNDFDKVFHISDNDIDWTETKKDTYYEIERNYYDDWASAEIGVFEIEE